LLTTTSITITPSSCTSRLRAACIEYLSMGGAFAAGPVGLLSGLTPASWVLVTHFFCVALFAVGKAVLPLPTPARLRKGYDLMHVACIIIMPLLAAERATFLSWYAVRRQARHRDPLVS
jgi:squalene monooxygenase